MWLLGWGAGVDVVDVLFGGFPGLFGCWGVGLFYGVEDLCWFGWVVVGEGVLVDCCFDGLGVVVFEEGSPGA